MKLIQALRPLGFVLLIGTITNAGIAQQTSSVTGRVTDSSTKAPIVGAQILIAGTGAGTITNSSGVYTIRGLKAGSTTVRVLSIGYAEQSRTVTLSAGAAATADFELRQSAVDVAPVVATVTGDQRRVEMGSSLAHVNAAKRTAEKPVANMADLLTAQAAGVDVYPGTQTGAGVRIRIRGTSSLSLSNNPIWIVDGVRYEGTTGSSSVSVGGTTVARIGDLNPEEIESMEIVRGPSAATLYGTDAANGVIVVTTKRGVAGKTRYNYYTEQTAITDRNTYPTAYRGWRTGTTSSTNSTPANTVQCFLTQKASGVCAQDSVTSYNLHDDADATPYGVGYRQQHGLQMSGGSEAVTFFLHGEWENEDGVTKVPEFDRRYLAARGLSLRDEQLDPNALKRVTTRANFGIAARDNLNVRLNMGYNTEAIRLPRSDDSGTAGIAANTYGGPGFKYNIGAAGDTLYGWREFLPHDVYEAVTKQDVNRLTTSASADWRPRGWLTARANFGVDYTNRHETQICRFSDCTSTDDRKGFKIDNRSNFFIYTLDANATGSRKVKEGIESQTAVGLQYYSNIFNRNGAQGTVLSPGATTVNAGATKAADETTSLSRTLGMYIEERVALQDRLFLTGAVRSDRNSAFGADFKTVFYPKLQASWVISQEKFFPTTSAISQLRLRASYGASGVQPGTTDAVPFYSPTQAIGEAGEAAGTVFTALGNQHLKPERSAEIELGFDANLFDDRINAELTYYNKNSKDALIERVLPPSLGTGSTVRFENLGEVRNKGWEARLVSRFLETSMIGWSLELNGSINDNKLLSLGGLPPLILSSTLQNREGYPLNGWWSRELLSFSDKNGNNIIEFNADPNISEIVVSDTTRFHGRSSPKYQAAVVNGFEFLNRKLRLSATVDYKGGHLIYNNSERIRCASRFNCSGLINPSASLEEQARVVMVREHPSRSVAGFFEKGDFIRFRELSLVYSPSEAVTERWFHTRSVLLSAGVRNLGMLWTKYTGVDPEAFGTTGDAPSSFQAFGPPTYFSFRLTLGL
jgi:TonB-linked SusC/RagA family outer membrane protein